jgi:uncharacterized radical SAM superfamily Fe-S cluster-containing enzyme/hemerythrin-like domain-containing protein
MNLAELEGLIDHVLAQHHEVERAMLEALRVQLEDGSSDKRLTAPFNHLYSELLLHMAKEETALFPALRSLVAGEAVDCSGAIRAMELEHDQISTIETALRVAARDAGHLECLILELVDDLEEHIRIENEELFPMAMAAMDAVGEEAGQKSEAPVSSGEPSPPSLDLETNSNIVIRHTTGVCPHCLELVPATLEEIDAAITLVQHCPSHGDSQTLLAKDSATWSELDAYYFSLSPWKAPQRDYQVQLSACSDSSCGCSEQGESSAAKSCSETHLSAEALLARQRGNRIELSIPSLDQPLEVIAWIERANKAGHTPVLQARLQDLSRAGLAGQLASAGLESAVMMLAEPQEHGSHRDCAPLSELEERAVEALREASIEVELVLEASPEHDRFGRLLTWCLSPGQDHIWKLTLTSLTRSCHTKERREEWTTEALMERALGHLEDVARDEVMVANKLYFAIAHALDLKRCLYEQHYLIFRDGRGGYQPLSRYLSPIRIDELADAYRQRLEADRPHLARIRLALSLASQGLRPRQWRILPHALGLYARLSRTPVPRSARGRGLVLSFSPSCHSHNYDEAVTHVCRPAVLRPDLLHATSRARTNLLQEQASSTIQSEKDHV